MAWASRLDWTRETAWERDTRRREPTRKALMSPWRTRLEKNERVWQVRAAAVRTGTRSMGRFAASMAARVSAMVGE